MTHKYAVVLAAGQGTRMKSKLHKVLHEVCDKPIIQHVVDNVQEAAIEDVIVVVGHKAESVKEQLEDQARFAMQEEQLGTGHAIMQCDTLLKDQQGTTLVINGDTPLVTPETIKNLLQYHEQEQASGTVLTTIQPDPTGYGRIVRDDQGNVGKIVEHKDATEQEREIDEINTGIFCFDNQKMWQALSHITNENQQGEYYITDLIEILKSQGNKVAAYLTSDYQETVGINNRMQLAEAEKILRERILHKHMINGVTLIDPQNTYIGTDVQIGQDTVIHPGTVLKGTTTIGEDCDIGPHADIYCGEIGDGVAFFHSRLLESKVKRGAKIGPYANIRPGTEVGEDMKVGNFVELKNSTIGNGSKVPHLAYIGDADIGEQVNIGCGAITVNYDGAKKHKTEIGSQAFIGCNVNLIAPVTVEDGAYVAAGSTINRDVPEKALAIAREKQTNKEGYADKLSKKK